MSRLQWSRTAVANLQHIAEFIREYSPVREQQVMESIIAGANQLATLPRSGQKREVLPSGREIRTLLVTKRYRLVYAVEVATDDVVILQVLDVRSDHQA